jgi:hypothetical protein
MSDILKIIMVVVVIFFQRLKVSIFIQAGQK